MSLKLYKAYNFRTKDPVIDEMRTIIQTENGGPGSKITRKHLKAIEDNGGPSAAAMYAWFFGKTRRPQSAPVEACGRALGWKRTWARMKPSEKNG